MIQNGGIMGKIWEMRNRIYVALHQKEIEKGYAEARKFDPSFDTELWDLRNVEVNIFPHPHMSMVEQEMLVLQAA